MAVSGGADSLMALALLREQGREVLALHAHFLPPLDKTTAMLPALEKACAALGADLAVIDLSREFHELIIAPFIRQYLDGLTPNPCALCNPRLKFGLLMDKALAMGCGSLATGHYARVVEHPRYGPSLRRGADPKKDQSYFLSLTPGERLPGIRLPLGDMTKNRVREELAARGLAPPLPRESQEICFIPGDDYCAFLEGHVRDLPGPGPIILSDGTKVGEHRGLHRHTLGQRRGLGVAHSEPLYVLDKDMRANALIVGPADEALATGLEADDLNILVPPDHWPDQTLVQSRYRQRAEPARVDIQGGTLRVTYEKPRSLPAPGQVAAVYDDQGHVLGAGVVRWVVRIPA